MRKLTTKAAELCLCRERGRSFYGSLWKPAASSVVSPKLGNALWDCGTQSAGQGSEDILLATMSESDAGK